MSPHRFIKHERFLDICLEITHSFDYGHGYSIKAKVWNMGFVESSPIGCNMRLNIAKREEDIKPEAGRYTCLKEWSLLPKEESTIKCFRNVKWRSL